MSVYFSEYGKVRVIQSGHIIELIQFQDNQSFIRKIDKNHYCDIRTGELKEYNCKSKTREDNQQSLRKTIKKIRRLINSNFGLSDNELFLTLTYAENMQDHNRVYDDFKAFIRRWRKIYGETEYMIVLEPQERGAWHIHALLKCENVPRWKTKKQRYDLNDSIADLWGQGFAYLEDLKHVDNVGAYLSAYLTNTKDKKGERLSLYPADMRIYRRSRGIKNPVVMDLQMDCALDMVDGFKCEYEAEYDIVDEDGKVVQHIVYQSYNLKKPLGGMFTIEPVAIKESSDAKHSLYSFERKAII